MSVIQEINDGDINVLWVTLPPVPLALLKLLRLSYLSGCNSARCRSFMNNVPCTDACKCKECLNTAAADPSVTDLDVEDDDLTVRDEV